MYFMKFHQICQKFGQNIENGQIFDKFAKMSKMSDVYIRVYEQACENILVITWI